MENQKSSIQLEPNTDLTAQVNKLAVASAGAHSPKAAKDYAQAALLLAQTQLVLEEIILKKIRG